MTTILRALLEDDFKIAEQLIINGNHDEALDENGLSALHVATLKNNINIVHKLLAAGFDPNTRTIKDEVYDEQEMTSVNEVIQSICSLGHKTPLHIAAKYGHIEIGKLLIAYGADPNILDAGKCTPLHWSASKGDAEFIELLLQNKAIVNAKDLANSTPIHESIKNHHIESVKVLLRHKCELDIVDLSGMSAIDLAKAKPEVYNLVADFFNNTTIKTIH